MLILSPNHLEGAERNSDSDPVRICFFEKNWICSGSAKKTRIFGSAPSQIRKLTLNDVFGKALNETELAAWKSFKKVCLNFLCLHKSDDFEDVVANLLRNYLKMGCKMSLKVHFYIHIYHLFMKTWEQFQMSTVRDFSKAILLLKRGSKESGQLECSLNTVGH